MALNSRKKKAKAREQAKEDRKEKWCPRPGKLFGCHGYYRGRHCPKCREEQKHVDR